MRILAIPSLCVVALLVTGCATPAENDPASLAASPAERSKVAIDRCVERARYLSPTSMQSARQNIGVKTDAEAAPILCERLLRALAEGRINQSDLQWDDGPHPMSMRLIRALKGR